MSTAHLTPQMIERTVRVVDDSGIVDLLVPPRKPGQVGRTGNIRSNTRLLLIGFHLATRLGHETTIKGAHQVLTEALPRPVQWDLGVLRPRVTGSAKGGKPFDPDATALVRNGKARKRVWANAEEIGLDDLYNASNALRKRHDYGAGSAQNLDGGTAANPVLDGPERMRRRDIVEQISDALIRETTIPRTGSTWAIDATGQWAWSRGSKKRKTQLESALRDGVPLDPDSLEDAPIALGEDGESGPDKTPAEASAAAHGVCLDAAWGYKTSKSGEKEVGFGFHQHTICRVPDPTAENDAEPLLVDGFVITPASSDVVESSLRLIDRIRYRQPFTRLLGDLLYTNLKAIRWAVPLANRGIEQGLAMRDDNHQVVDINGAKMQHGYLHCPSAPMEQLPRSPDHGSPEEWDTYSAGVEDFQTSWAFDRKESGLGSNPTSKWICPARAGRAGCHALGPIQVQASTDLGLPIITPPADWATRKCCTQKTMDFTPDPANTHHQRKLMQREYYGSRRWRRLYKRRALVEGVFGILKNSSRQRLRRGHNRLPGLAWATIFAALKVSLYNEEQLRIWHDRTGRGPLGHPLLRPDPVHFGFVELTRAQAEAIDAEHLRRLAGGTGDQEADLAA